MALWKQTSSGGRCRGGEPLRPFLILDEDTIVRLRLQVPDGQFMGIAKCDCLIFRGCGGFETMT